MNSATTTNDSQATLARLERTVERITGTSAAELRRRSIDEQRETVERQHGRPMQFVRRFPLSGRGNVLRDRIMSRAEIDRMVDETRRCSN